jgi:hypothetical protein
VELDHVLNCVKLLKANPGFKKTQLKRNLTMGEAVAWFGILCIFSARLYIKTKPEIHFAYAAC